MHNSSAYMTHFLAIISFVMYVIESVHEHIAELFLFSEELYNRFNQQTLKADTLTWDIPVLDFWFAGKG